MNHLYLVVESTETKVLDPRLVQPIRDRIGSMSESTCIFCIRSRFI